MSKARTHKVLSCAECRRLKVKCDLTFPCAHCRKRGLASICPSGELREGLKGQRVLAGTESLHKRIADLEAALCEASSPSHPLLQLDIKSDSDVSPSTSTARPSGSPDNCGRDGVNSFGRNGDALDRLSSYNHLVVEEEAGRSRYYGAASSVYLTRRSNLRPCPPTSLTSPPPPPLFDLPAPSAFSSELLPSRSIGVAEIMQRYLPSETVARDLSDIYYRSFGWFTNIVPFPSFHARYLEPSYHSSKPTRPQHLTVLLLVLALGVIMDNSDQTAKDDAVRTYLTGARLSLALDPSHSVTLVQICYLYVTYIMNGRKDTAGGEAGWPFLRAGMAVAEAVGLHRDPAQWELDKDEATERRIVFWEIHGYDVLQSIALGRGHCIADSAIDCGYPDDGDETEFHRKAYALTRIWSRINERQIRIAPSPYADFIAIDDALRQYEQSLPPHLASTATASLLDVTDPRRKRLAFRRNMLLMYLTEARIALHRGWFVRAIKEYPLEPLDSPQHRSYLACLEACRTLVGLVRGMLSLHDQQINKRWHFWFHLFSACACLAACAIRAPRGSLAPAVMSELEGGIALFRLAGRDETVSARLHLQQHTQAALADCQAHLESLAEKGREALNGLSRPGDESEDLDLLSARKTFRRSGTAMSDATHADSISPQTQIAPSPFRSAGDNLDTFPSFDSQTNTGEANVSSYCLDNPHLGLSGGDAAMRGGNAQQTMLHPSLMGFPLPQESTGWGMGAEQDFGAVGEFDMDAFLREMGLL